MSTYSQYGVGTMTASDEICANESYAGVIGAYRMIEENSVNEHSIFEAVIGRDFMEVLANNGAVTESALEAVNEASLSGIWGKVVEFIQKIGEKIKGILHTLRIKIESVFIRDGKELVKKYDKEIIKKFNSGAYTKMKFKYAKPKKDFEADVMDAINKNVPIDAAMTTANKFSKFSYSGSTNKEVIAKVYEDDEHKPLTEEQKTEYKEKALSAIIGATTTSKEFAKDFDAYMFEDEDEVEGFSEAMHATIKASLENGKKELKAVNDEQKETDKITKEWKNAAEKIQKEMTAAMGKEGFTDKAAIANALAGRTITFCSIASAISGLAYGALGTAIKKNLKQCRAIYMKAVTYTAKKSTNEQTSLLEAVTEVSDYEVEEMFA